jgi:hypothetical protein
MSKDLFLGAAQRLLDALREMKSLKRSLDHAIQSGVSQEEVERFKQEFASIVARAQIARREFGEATEQSSGPANRKATRARLSIMSEIEQLEAFFAAPGDGEVDS